MTADQLDSFLTCLIAVAVALSVTFAAVGLYRRDRGRQS